LEEREHTKRDNIKDNNLTIRPCAGKTPSIATHANTHDLPLVRTKHLHKLDSIRLFLPKLDNTVITGGNQKVRLRSHCDKREIVTVHQRFAVALCGGQRREILLFERLRQNLSLLSRNARRRG
jgi:hypothetical protein